MTQRRVTGQMFRISYIFMGMTGFTKKSLDLVLALFRWKNITFFCRPIMMGISFNLIFLTSGGEPTIVATEYRKTFRTVFLIWKSPFKMRATCFRRFIPKTLTQEFLGWCWTISCMGVLTDYSEYTDSQIILKKFWLISIERLLTPHETYFLEKFKNSDLKKII